MSWLCWVLDTVVWATSGRSAAPRGHNAGETAMVDRDHGVSGDGERIWLSPHAGLLIDGAATREDVRQAGRALRRAVLELCVARAAVAASLRASHAPWRIRRFDL
jgi:hypothetical protein